MSKDPPKQPQPIAVVFFSNPYDTARLRLDLEHRSIDELLVKLKLEPLNNQKSACDVHR